MRLVAAVAAAAYGLAVEFGPWPAVLTCSAGAAVGCVAGAVLLRTSGVGRVTWRNRLAGYLIPWGGAAEPGEAVAAPGHLVGGVDCGLRGGGAALPGSGPDFTRNACRAARR